MLERKLKEMPTDLATAERLLADNEAAWQHKEESNITLDARRHLRDDINALQNRVNRIKKANEVSATLPVSSTDEFQVVKIGPIVGMPAA